MRSPVFFVWRDRPVEGPFFHVNRHGGIVNDILRGQSQKNNIQSGVHAPLSDKRFRSSVVISQIDRAGLVNKISKLFFEDY